MMQHLQYKPEPAASEALCVQEMLYSGAMRLKQAGILGARLDTRLLLAAAMGVAPEVLLMQQDRYLTAEQEQCFRHYIQRRLNREPVSRILENREFWSIDFIISPDVLDPRADSEILVESALEFARTLGNAPYVLDIGTGSGCLLLSLLSELPQATGTGVDVNTGALEIARRNTQRLGMSERVRMIYDDWGAGLAESFDIILSNPPYIPHSDVHGLEPEVKNFDPKQALDGGEDGFSCYRALLPVVKSRLAPAGRAFIESGYGQADEIIRIAASCGLEAITTKPDLAGVTRCIILHHVAE